MYQSALLRLDGAAIAAGAIGAYALLDASWLLFVLLFLVPDCSMVGYLVNARLGSRLYNAGHSYAGPVALLGLGVVVASDLLLAGGLVWTAHVGVDRAVGYGYKYADAPFSQTHLQRLAPTGEAGTAHPTDATVTPE